MLCAIPIMSASPEYSNWMDDVAANTNANLQAPLHRNWMGRNGLYKTLKEDSLLSQNASLLGFVQQLDVESQGMLKKISDSLLQNNLAAAWQLNQNVSAYTMPDSLSKEMNSVLIAAVLSSPNDWVAAISGSGWDSIRYFASLCPFEYGENVYLARVVLKLVGDTTEYSNECEVDAPDMPDKSAQYGNDESLTTLVYPNPAKDVINIETEMILPATFTIYSAIGQELFSAEISDIESVILFSDIKPQPVFYVIRSANGELIRGTLTIIE